MYIRLSRHIKTEAFVLRKRHLLDKNSLVTLFSHDYGKINVVAKGIKKITSRRSAHIQTGNLVSAELYTKGESQYLQNTTIKSGFSQIKGSMDKINYLYRFLFILDRMLPEQQPEPDVFKTTVRFLIYLSKTDTVTHDTFSVYLQEILHSLGYGKDEKSYPDLVRKIEEIIHEKVPEHVII